MKYTEQEIRDTSNRLIESFGDLLTWQWDENKHVLLAEFASGKADEVISILQQILPNEWNNKTIKKAPSSLRVELGNYAKLVKEQRIFTDTPQFDKKGIAALLWPWGHGSTLSLRLTLLETPYHLNEKAKRESFIVRYLKKYKLKSKQQ